MESPARCRYAYNYVGDFLGDAKDGGNDLVLHPTLNFGVDGLGWHAPEYPKGVVSNA